MRHQYYSESEESGQEEGEIQVNDEYYMSEEMETYKAIDDIPDDLGINNDDLD